MAKASRETFVQINRRLSRENLTAPRATMFRTRHDVVQSVAGDA